MTCVVGLVHNDVIYMAGDSAGISNYSLRIRKDKKVFTNGKFIFGFTTSFRMGQLLQYNFNPPIYLKEKHKNVHQFMSTDFVDELRRCLKEGGYARKDSEAEKGGVFIVGFKGLIFQVYDDYQIAEFNQPYAACGCGEDIALGSLFTTEDSGMNPVERVNTALRAAAEFSAGVHAPFLMETMPFSEGE